MYYQHPSQVYAAILSPLDPICGRNASASVTGTSRLPSFYRHFIDFTIFFLWGGPTLTKLVSWEETKYGYSATFFDHSRTTFRVFDRGQEWACWIRNSKLFRMVCRSGGKRIADFSLHPPEHGALWKTPAKI